ncbi:hypothetical protein FCIRC_7816 [Fusarium circinatum]|uniref:2EXR domain-containing protein n=1 Tax=Fusarium circinatum TaxID=48490 RepID=A0A8H5TRQ3_FUSCI|nr:hypothetical protein FCIRC_7816 [Fusarium circinatum]
MEERTFHLFSQLPLELREHIWKMAMRPDKPGVQIFRIYHPELDNPRHAKDIYGFTLKDSSYFVPPCSYRLALPVWNKYPDSTDGSSDHNISTYLIDSSLWTVCQESRSMMRRVFGTNDASRQRLLGSATAHYLSGGAASYVTICPEKDLIVLQFDDMFKFKWRFLNDLFNTKTYYSAGILNIGIEYHIEWGMNTYKDDENPLNKLYSLAYSGFSINIWLIDHNLKRRKGTRRQKDSRKEAYRNPRLKHRCYANDRIFSKVNLRQKRHCMGHWKYLKLISDNYHDSSIHFANRLRHKVWTTNVISQTGRPPCHVGLLGWDDI